MGLLNGKVAIVTGAAGGQGEAEARQFVAEGAQVVMTDVSDAARAVAEELGPQALFVQHDVASELDWDDVVQATVERFGRVDILVNNAAVYNPQALQDTSPADFERHMRVNQTGAFLGMRAVTAPMARCGGGSIVNIGSGLGLSGTSGNFAYAATKWALRGMTRCAARDLAPLNIRVNAVLPGLVRTTMLDAREPALIEQVAATLPIKRLGLPEEIAKMVLFIASDTSAYMTGAEIVVDGGGSA